MRSGHTLVALRKESVDRNKIQFFHFYTLLYVALRKESVDRNNAGALPYDEENESLSARRAWIEIAPDLQVHRAALGRSPQGERG